MGLINSFKQNKGNRNMANFKAIRAEQKAKSAEKQDNKKRQSIPLKHKKLDGAYMGTHPKLPKPDKRLVLIFSKQGVDKQGFRPVHLFDWNEVTGFDFTGHVMDGVFQATLSTTSGDLILETASFHASSASGNQMYADRRRRKLNNIKLLVIEHTRSAKSA
jgi:hypothetical protein